MIYLEKTMEPLAMTSASEGVPTSSSHNLRLEKAAHQFEASLMQELFKPLEKDSMSTADGDADNDSGGTLSAFASEAMARAISDRGGFGIAKKLIDHFEKVTAKA